MALGLWGLKGFGLLYFISLILLLLFFLFIYFFIYIYIFFFFFLGGGVVGVWGFAFMVLGFRALGEIEGVVGHACLHCGKLSLCFRCELQCNDIWWFRSPPKYSRTPFRKKF